MGYSLVGMVRVSPVVRGSIHGSLAAIPAVHEFFETLAARCGVYNWGINPATYRATTANGGSLESEQVITERPSASTILVHLPAIRYPIQPSITSPA